MAGASCRSKTQDGVRRWLGAEGGVTSWEVEDGFADRGTGLRMMSSARGWGRWRMGQRLPTAVVMLSVERMKDRLREKADEGLGDGRGGRRRCRIVPASRQRERTCWTPNLKL